MIDELSAALEEDLVVDANKKVSDYPLTINENDGRVHVLHDRDDVIEYGRRMWRIIADYQMLHALDATKLRELMANQDDATAPTITVESPNAQVQALRMEIVAGEALRTAAWEALESYVHQAYQLPSLADGIRGLITEIHAMSAKLNTAVTRADNAEAALSESRLRAGQIIDARDKMLADLCEFTDRAMESTELARRD